MIAPTDKIPASDSDSDLLAPILDQHAEWFSRVLRHAFYGDAAGPVADGGRAPRSFAAWADRADPARVAAMKALHADLEQVAMTILQSPAVPDMAAFDRLSHLYEEFVLRLHRMERDSLSQRSGADALTGLRSRAMLAGDLAREMDRLARRGQPFSLALIRINDVETMTDDILVRVAAAIQKTIRSFDDAYRLDGGEFIMVLKQTDRTGGAAGVNRLRQFMQDADIRVTVSCCVGEPQPDDDIDQLIRHMREDLDRLGPDLGGAVEYADISPLERFVHGMDHARDAGGRNE